MPSSTPYFSIAASVSPPPASENALLRAIACAIACVPSPNWSNSNTPTGPFQTIVPACSRIAPSARPCRARCRGSSRRPRPRGCRARRHAPSRRTRAPRPRRWAAGSRRRARAPCSSRLARHVEHVRLVQRLADADAGGGEEGVGDAAADDQLVDLVEQRLEHRELGRDLGAGDDRDQRPRRLARARARARRARRPAAARRRPPARSAPRRACWPRRGARCRRRPSRTRRTAPPCVLRERLVVLLLALVEAHVLAQHHRAGRAVDAAEPVALQRHRLAEQLGRAARRPARARTPRRTRPLRGGRGARAGTPRALVERQCGSSAARRGCARRW